MRKRSLDIILRIILLIFIIAITILLFQNRDKIKHLENYGYLGIFLMSILANATIILPIPGVILTALMGAVFSPLFVALVAGAGAALGELSGYLAGYSGSAIIENQKWYARTEKWMRDHGNLALFLLALIPNPLFDLAGIAAGMLGIQIGRFLFWVLLGKIIKMMFFAFGGNLITLIIE